MPQSFRLLGVPISSGAKAKRAAVRRLKEDRHGACYPPHL